MTGTRKPPTPSTHQFNKHIEEQIRPALSERYSRPQVSVLIDLLRFLEQQRYDFSASRAFQTRPISNAAIADHFGVVIRTVRRWLAQLEQVGILSRVERKNPNHSYKNLLNRIRFNSFCEWFRGLLEKTPDTVCPPNKKDIKNISVSSKYSGGEKGQKVTFPVSGSVRYDPYWRDIAQKNLPSGRTRPCMNMVAQRFRENLQQHGISLDHPSVTSRWTNFCKRARPV